MGSRRPSVASNVPEEMVSPAKTRSNRNYGRNTQEVGVEIIQPLPGQTVPIVQNASNDQKTGKRQTIAGLSGRVDNMQNSITNNSTRVETLQSSVNDVHSKLDSIIRALPGLQQSNNTMPSNTVHVNASNPQPAMACPDTVANNTVRAGPSRPGTSALQPLAATQQHNYPLPPPTQMVREENRHGQIDRLIAKEDFRPTSSHGKPSHFENGMIKPYFYIDREGVQTLKQKLDLRSSMTAIEYISCSLLLLRDPDAFHPDDKHDILQHITDVSVDANTLAWPAVRRWTQTIWDAIERGRCTWANYHYIQQERVRISFVTSNQPNNMSQNSHASRPSAQQTTDVRSLLCRDYNGPHGCRFTATHEEANVKYLHACAHCDSMGRRSAHSFQRCRARMDGQNYSDQRSWQHKKQDYSHEQLKRPVQWVSAEKSAPLNKLPKKRVSGTGDQAVFRAANESKVGEHLTLTPAKCQQIPTVSNPPMCQETHVVNSETSNEGKISTNQSINFDRIREVCATTGDIDSINSDPQSFIDHRQNNWPHINNTEIDAELVNIYEQVRSTGLPNALKARIQVPSKLNIQEWEAQLTDSIDDQELLGFLKFGFPMGYMGPTSESKHIPNHASALTFPHHVDRFIEKEVALGGIVGPIKQPPFVEWAHVSPLMTRDKKGSDDRRVIIDMSYPIDNSVNAYMYKNCSLGRQRDHTLPSVDDVVKIMSQMGTNAYIASTDISRAYKNFVSCPLDWPLLAFQWKESFYCDITMPFGARSSSCHMQRISNAVSAMLRRRGVESRVYLDDLIIISPDYQTACRDVEIVQELLSALGLPEAVDKRQGPSKVVTWLGIQIDAQSMTLSIPQEKINEVMVSVNKALGCKTISLRHLQSLLGKLLHIAKCIRPARVFVSRLLDALRNMTRKFTKISHEMRCDLLWFKEFAEQWNGVSIIPPPNPNITITVDASGSGIGAYDGGLAYAGSITPINDPADKIAELEAVNLVVAIQTFVTKEHRGSHILVRGVNMSSVLAFESGKARNHILTDCARHLWMTQAVLDIRISYEYISTKDNFVADSLSRMHLSSVFQQLANKCVKDGEMKYVMPNLYIVTVLNPPIFSRRGIPIAPTVCI